MTGGGETMSLFAKRTAIISECGLYRYELRRIWDDALPPLVVGMLNPSVADADIDDPTIVRCWRRAEALGCGSLIVWNLGAGRATDPVVWQRMRDPIGPENDAHILRILIEAKERDATCAVGWGATGGYLRYRREIDVTKIAREVGVVLHCLGTTKDGQPRHPLYVAYSQPLIEWVRR